MQRREYLEKIMESSAAVGIPFTWEYYASCIIHVRHIVTGHEWKIQLDQGVDFFQHYCMNDAFDFTNWLQQFRQCKVFEVTLLKTSTGE